MDGPFRNTALPRRWKQYGNDLVSDAASSEERTDQVYQIILVDMKVLAQPLSTLKAHAQASQMDLHTVSSAEAIFDKHAKSPQTDILKRHLIANLREPMSFERALDQAVQGTVTDCIEITKNRLDEECIKAADIGNMTHMNCRKAIKRNHAAFGDISPNQVCDALLTGSVRAYKQFTRKRIGVDEGPEG